MNRCTWLAAVVVAVVLILPRPAAADPDYWDPRLDELGLFLYQLPVQKGEWYWRLVRGEFENEQQAQGRHHIFLKCLDYYGNPIENMLTWTVWPSLDPRNYAWQATKGRLDGYWGNFPMAGGNWCPPFPVGPMGPYGVMVDFSIGVSDSVWGMGLPCNRHVAYRFTWQYTLKE